jgi:hypothetical protein
MLLFSVYERHLPHETCIHRWGWQVILHPDGTTEARSPDGKQVLHSHAPPGRRAA